MAQPKSITVEVANTREVRDDEGTPNMPNVNPSAPQKGQELISLAQKLARDAERHALLSASLASQADRLMMAGLRLLESKPPVTQDRRISR